MITSLIILLELGLFSLILLLAFRVLSLTRSEPLIPAGPESNQFARSMEVSNLTPPSKPVSPVQSPDRSELISQLHILASLQMRDCKQQSLDIDSAHLAVREYTVCWLYGAACALSRPGQRNSEALIGVVAQFAGRKAGIRQSEAVAVISTLTRHSAFLACFRSGVEGAEFWRTHHFIPRDKSLFDAVTSNAFV